MPFGLWARMGPRNHVGLSDGIQIAPCKRAILGGKDMPGRVRRHPVVSCAIMAEPIEMPFMLRTRIGPRKQVLHGVHIGATWRVRLNRLCAAAVWPFCRITLTTCYYYWPLYSSPANSIGPLCVCVCVCVCACVCNSYDNFRTVHWRTRRHRPWVDVCN